MEAGVRIVDTVTLHEGPLRFSELAERVITERTRFLVLDLDRTIHLGRNMGELLGWEVAALRAYGADELARMEPTRSAGRLLFDVARPLGSTRYILAGARTWAAPGLYYLFLGKLPARSDLLRAWTFRRFGPEPVRTVQRVPQETLMRIIAGVPEAQLRELAERIWDRHADDQVITREHLDRLRARYPRLRIAITSASPRAVVEVARDRLGADFAEHSEHGRINSGPAKIARLRERLPEVLDPRSETVGITDTGYGEDHCWAEHFTRVVDANSDAPFSPLVGMRSPLREVHSAELLTRREEARRSLGDPAWLDPRRAAPPRERARTLRAAELSLVLGDLRDEAERLSADPVKNAWPLTRLLRDARRRIAATPSEAATPVPARVQLA